MKNAHLLIFVRHAHREKPIPDSDNGLSEKGFKQVDDLLKDLKKEKLPQSHFFWSSPKKRCLETLKPLSEACKSAMKIEPLLDEQKSDETPLIFIKRIETVIEKAKSTKGAVYLCSHGDVIPMAIDLLTGKSIDVKKGEAIILKPTEGSRWEIL